MKKEVMIAILLGLVTGGIVAFGVYLARTSLHQRATESRTEQLTNITETDPSINSQASQIVMFSPDNETIIDTSTVQVSGKSIPNSPVVVLVNDAEDYVTTTDSTGNFSVEVTLSLGGNVIVTTVLGEENTTYDDTRVVVYSTADLNASPPATASASPSPSPSTEEEAEQEETEQTEE